MAEESRPKQEPASRDLQHEAASANRSSKARLRNAIIWLGAALITAGICVFVGVFIAPTIVAMFPGPHVRATIWEERILVGNTSGCVFYAFMLQTDQPIHHANLKIQAPYTINDYQVAFPIDLDLRGNKSSQTWQTGRDEKGRCAVVGPTSNDSGDVQVISGGSVISVRATEIPEHTRLLGMIATTEEKSNTNAAYRSVSALGDYEYIKLGQTIPQELPISIVKGVRAADLAPMGERRQ